MESLNVLEQTEIMVSSLPVWWDNLLQVGAIFLIIAVVFYIISFCRRDERIAIGTLVCAIGCMLTASVYLIGFYTQSKIPTGRYTYKVEITEETALDYIYDNYDVISSDSRVWTIEDK